MWGRDSNKFRPERFLDVNGRFTKPESPKFHAFGDGPRLWYVPDSNLSYKCLILSPSPGMGLSTYEFVSLMMQILGRFDFEPLEPGRERHHIDAFTPFMDGPFYVKVREIEG